jgi:hypothetical protein
LLWQNNAKKSKDDDKTIKTVKPLSLKKPSAAADGF